MDKNQLYVNYGNDPLKMGYEILEAIHADAMIRPGMKIAIKPNLVVAKPADSGATTTPELVEGVIRYLQEKGCSDITIMEGSWLGDNTKRAFEVCGYTRLSKKYNISLQDLKSDSTVSCTHEGMTIKVCKSALETDFLINMPVLKGHCQTYMTCALIAGCDSVLIDTYVASLMGYMPEDIDYIKYAEKLGVGSADISKADIVEMNNENKPSGKITVSNKTAHLSRYIQENQACSACYGSLIHALNRMDETGRLNKINKKISIGQGYKRITFEGIGVGNCTSGFSTCIRGCPPRAVDIIETLSK